MKKILLSIIVLLGSFSFGQNSKISGISFRPFKNKIILSNSFADKYYNGNLVRDSASIENGKFSFKTPNKTSDLPYAYLFIDKINPQSFYQSSIFFIDSKTKNLILGKENSPENFEVASDSDFIKKEILKFQNYFANFNKEKNNFNETAKKEYEQFEDKTKIPQDFWDKYEASEKDFSVKEDSILLNYVKANPNSFVALWKLIEKFEQNGYSQTYQEAFNHLSLDIKSKKTTKTLELAMKNASVFQIGKKFPVSKLKNIDNSKMEFSIPQAKYTLVDFWFSSCKPCLEQMPQYVELYSKYQAKGFQIIGIATDQNKYKNNLENTIQKFKIPWNNYWDQDGKQSSMWTITSFPTNFLLDENGNILAKNISEKELSELLSKNFN